MTALILFPKPGSTRFIELKLNDTRQGLDFILFSLENFSHSEEDHLSLSINERGNQDFPAINFQKNGQFFLFQIYVSDQHSSLEEGWYTLVEDSIDLPPEELISTVWDEPGDNFFQACFADGLMLSHSLLTSKDSLVGTLEKYTNDLPAWLNHGKFVNLGII
ncbi:hypothetical protein DP090_018335 [Pseudomonas sp. MDMC216]|jgi:hypothetical protein|nr:MULTISPECIES: hypothetical protein [Pseudomonas]MBA4681636.1 hypothetical protein [Pseudomonas sp.]MDI5994976.1 hypothetical protein [Pseudomonas sp. MDMC216]MDI6007752.1 hypothetical protein [Pseudomonas sp. MDMC17]MDZ4194865.1 hypothetical protein [Pseudomonas sp.]RAR32690.1 hypothetical protein DP092_19010 [Pseudomonas sp. MDMC224]